MMDPKTGLAGAIAALALTVSVALAAPGAAGHSHRTFAAGEPGNPKVSARTIEVLMKETDDGKMLYEPAQIDVKRGEQIRFVLKNAGKVDHEF
jgi:uncharacterized cupredoxin-like copper-binding protein